MQMYTAYLGNRDGARFIDKFSTNMEAADLEEAKRAAIAVLNEAGRAQGATAVRLQENGGEFVWEHP